MFLFIIALVVSSPQHAAAHFEEIIDNLGATGVWVQYTVSLIMWLFAILMPVFVQTSSSFIGFYTRSEEQKSTIFVTIVFMFYLIVLLPILGFNFGPDLIEFLTDTTKMTSEKWQVSTINEWPSEPYYFIFKNLFSLTVFLFPKFWCLLYELHHHSCLFRKLK